MEKQHRVLRVLEYTGPKEWVEMCMERRHVKGTHHFGRGKVIREGVVGDGYPESLGGDLIGDVNALLYDVMEKLPKDGPPDIRSMQARAEILLGRHARNSRMEDD